MFGGLLACYTHGARVRACDNALTFQQNNWPHCGSIWSTSCCKDGFFFHTFGWFIHEPERNSKQTERSFYCLNGNPRLQPIHGSFIAPSLAYCWGLNGLVRFQQVCYFRTNGNSGAQLFSVSCTKTSHILAYLYFIWPIILFQSTLSHYLIFPKDFFFPHFNFPYL